MGQKLTRLFPSGAVDLMIATAVAGGAGYLLTFVAGIELGPARYVAFGVLWSSLFFAVGALNGVQQEVARATRRAPTAGGTHVVRDVTLGLAAVAFLVAVGTSPLWVHLIFTSASLWLALPLALGLVGHTITTSLIGMLHGLHLVRMVAGIVIVDAALRLGLSVIALNLSRDITIVSWALVLPYLVTPVLVWAIARRKISYATIDVNRRTLLRNVGSTIVAAVASGALISGVSLLVAVAGRDTPPAAVGAVIFAINITRAPLIIVVAAMQNYVVVRLRDRADWLRILLRLAAGVAFGTLVFSVLIGIVGEGLFAYLLDGESVDPFLLALIAGSGGLVALMSLSGAAIIARGGHSMNTVGWLAAAATTATTLLIIPSFESAVSVGLVAGPLVGLLAHGAAIAIDYEPKVKSSADPPVPEF